MRKYKHSLLGSIPSELLLLAVLGIGLSGSLIAPSAELSSELSSLGPRPGFALEELPPLVA